MAWPISQPHDRVAMTDIDIRTIHRSGGAA